MFYSVLLASKSAIKRYNEQILFSYIEIRKQKFVENNIFKNKIIITKEIYFNN